MAGFAVRTSRRFFAFLVLLPLAASSASLPDRQPAALEKFGLGFLWTEDWDPVKEKFGALVPIYGTLVTSAIALLIGVPVSFGIAIFLTELSPVWLRRPLGTAIEMLAAIPSIIYGMWGLFVFAPLFQTTCSRSCQDARRHPVLGPLFSGPPIGIGMLTAGIILAVMVIPFITAVMRDVFELVPPMLKESAYGLGSTTWEVVWRVVLPYTKVGVIGGIMLGLGRALGETMAVTFVIGNAHRLNASPVRARQLDRLGARQRVHRSRSRPVHRRADRAGPDPLPHHHHRARRCSKLLLMQLASARERGHERPQH